MPFGPRGASGMEVQDAREISQGSKMWRDVCWLTIRGLSDSEFMMTSPFYQPRDQYQP